MNLRASDVGFGRVKAMGDHEQVDFPAVTAPFKPIRFTSGIGGEDAKERLCLEYGGKQLFAGNIAFKQGVAQVRMAPDRFVKAEGLSLLFAALALLAERDEEAVHLVAGLPVSDYAERRAEYERTLLGKHEIKLLYPEGSLLGFYRFNVKAVKVLPQPAGTFFDRILDRGGQLVNKFLASGNVGILDIGFNTVDLARFDQLDFIDSESESFSDLGLSECWKDLAREIKAVHGIEVRPLEMENFVRGGAIPGSELRSILNEKKKVYAAHAEKIVSRALNTWRDAWQLNRIFIAGGGAAALGEYLLRQFDDPKQVEICANSVFTNCSGYLRYGKRLWPK